MPRFQSAAGGSPVLVRNRATVATGFVTGMLSGLVARGDDPAGLLESAGVDTAVLSDPTARLPIQNYAALYNLVVQYLDDEGFALFSIPLRAGTFEFLCRSILNSRTLAEALERAGRFLHIVLPDLQVSIVRNPNSANLVISEIKPLQTESDNPCRIFAFEWLLRLLHGLSCWLVGRGISLDKVRFPYARPPHAHDYDLIYTEKSSFGGPSLVASLKPNLLDLPIRRDEEALSAFLVGAPGKISMLYRRDRECVRQVRDIIATALPQTVTLEEAASQVHLSPRTLHRRLQEEGSNFRAIKDAVRRDFALSKLEKTRLPVAQIAADLGYAEPSAFFRAFQDWTGQAPSNYRKNIARQSSRNR